MWIGDLRTGVWRFGAWRSRDLEVWIFEDLKARIWRMKFWKLDLEIL